MAGAVGMQGAATDAPRLPLLPELRQDLQLEKGAPDLAGADTWVVIDRAQHRYIQIDRAAHQLLSRWRAGISHDELRSAVARDFGQRVSADEIAAFVRFVSDNALTVEPAHGDWQTYARMADAGKTGWLAWLIHNYLYFKLPLVRPEPFLVRGMPFVAPLFTRGAFAVVAAAGLLGLYLVSRQWDAFYATFQHFFSWQGAAIYAVALIVIKSAHELGHAFTALRFGCRVPTMGICFLVMFPVLYTDVTDAWRLRSRRERLLIGSAGIAVELAIACFATLLWTFLPDGVARSLAFSFATVGWVLSLAINLNPLMRFDGYYLFSDLIGVDNLQSRAFAFGQWRLREVLFGLQRPAPELVPQRTATILIVYAWAVWLYRLILFTGIALLVYHMAFKLLGIVLFLIEIIYFIARPMAAEARAWTREGYGLLRSRRARLTLMIVASALLAVFVPWSSRVSVPAIIESADIARVYPQRAGLVEKVLVKAGDTVAAGDVLVQLQSSELDHQIALTKNKIALLKLRLARRSSDAEDRSKSLVLEQELRALSVQLAGLQKERSDLVVAAPIAGTVAEFSSSVHAGRAIGRAEFIGLIRGTTPMVVRGYVAQRDVARLGPQATGRFMPELPGAASLDVTLSAIANAGANDIELPELASVHGGPIAVRPHASDGRGKRLAPVTANYLATMTVDGLAPPPGLSVRGYAVLDGARESIAGRVWRHTAAVFIRESGF